MRRATVEAILSLVVLIAVVVVTIVRIQPPGKAQGIDAERVRGFLRRIAIEPHPAGSEGNARLREWLINELTGLGWRVTTQKGQLPHWRFPDELVPLTNVIARLEGTAGGDDALLLVAHYDSRPGGSHGAGDDGTGVAALLEVATQFADDPPKNDVILLLSDAEEAGLLGARWWVLETAPHYMGAKVVLNFEGRGSAGPAILFETGRGDAWLVDQYARSAPHPVTSSLAPAVYKVLPNGTDFTAFIANTTNLPGGLSLNEAVRASPPDLPGLNFAFIDRYDLYHAPEDDAAHLSDRTLLHQAAQAVAVARRLAEADLTKARAENDAIFFDVWSLGVVRYPSAWRWPVLAGALGIAGVGIARQWRRTGTWKAWLWSAVALLGALVGVIAWTQLIAWFLPHPAVGAWYGVAFAAMAVIAGGAVGLLQWRPGTPRHRKGSCGSTSRGRDGELDSTRLRLVEPQLPRTYQTAPSRSAARAPIGVALLTLVTVPLAIGAAVWLPGASYLPAAVLGAGGLALLTHDTRAWPIGLVGVAGATILLTFAAWMVGLALTLRLPGVATALLLAMGVLWAPFVWRREV